LTVSATFDSLLGSIEPTSGAIRMVFVLITNHQSFTQQHAADALAHIITLVAHVAMSSSLHFF
jgi:Holliday junction resolvasome RuvABC endonuclease subunit